MSKLIFVNRYFYPDHSATSQMLSDLAFALANAGDLDIHVLTSRQGYDDPAASLPPHETVQGVTVHRLWTSNFGRKQLLGRAVDYFSFYLTAFFSLLSLADRHSVIIAKTDPPLISVVAAVAAKLKSAALINWIQDLFPEVAAHLGVKGVSGPAFSVLRWVRNFSLHAARCNVVIGELMAMRLLQDGVPGSKIMVVHNWADAKIRPMESLVNPLRREWGVDNKFVVGYSGNFGRSHEFATILDAAAALEAHTDIVFLFIGGGAKLDWLQRQVAQRGLRNILFKPYQARERLTDSLTAADVHLVTLKPELEGLIVPSKFYGIAAAGRPVAFIGSQDGEIGRLIHQIRCGYTVPQGDGEGLCSVILELYRNPGRRREMGASARTAFDRTFSLHSALERWQSLIHPLPEQALEPDGSRA